MNKQKLKAICMKVSKKTGLSYNSVLTHYFLEQILKRIANSKEKSNFIFKGGFLLSNVIGIGERTTVDIDFSIRQFELTEKNIKEKFLEMIGSSKSDDIIYEIVKIEEIRKEDDYGGYRLTILCKLDNIRQFIPLDIATGDPVTPCEISYQYNSIFENETFSICAYNIETILAEKIQTIYHRGLFNSRSKDFYDLYILYRLKKTEIDFKVLKKACLNTFKYRNTVFDKEKILMVLNDLKNEQNFYNRWKSYQKKYPYSKGIAFDEIIENIKELLITIK